MFWLSSSNSSSSPFHPSEMAWPEAEALAFWFWSHLSLANLRRVFYLVTPEETSFQAVEHVPDFNIQLFPWWAMLLLLELALLRLSGHSHRFALDDSIASISAGILSQLFRSSGRTFSLLLYTWIWQNWRLLELDAQNSLVWATCLVSQDLAYYLGHRAMHEIGLLWAFHSVHHSGHYLNLSTAFRQPILQDLGLAPYELLQAVAIPPPLFLVHRYFSHIFQFWLHTSLLGSLGPLGLVLNTPAHHRVHHGRNAYCIDRNFGALLIVWDRLFGTFQAEREGEPPQFGLANGHEEEGEVFEQFRMQLDPLRRVFHVKGTWRAKAKELAWPPGWRQGMKTRQFFHWRSLANPGESVPEKCLPSPFRSPSSSLPASRKAYLLFHFLLLLPMFVHFQYSRAEMGWPEFVPKMVFFLASLWAFGAVLERKKFAVFVELIRCLGLCLHQLCHQNGFQFPSMFLASIFALSALFTAFSWPHLTGTKGGRKEKLGGMRRNIFSY